MRHFAAGCVSLGLLVGGTACTRVVHSPPPPPALGYAADGQVEQVTEPAADDSRYKIEADMTFRQSVAVHAPAPRYPESLLARQLPPVTVRVRMVVGTTGAVTSVTPLDAADVEPEFVQAVVDTLMGWRFDPLIRTRNGVVEALPYSEIERFVFRQVNGRAVVEK